MTKVLYEIADELRAIADYGLMHVQNDYDRDRYEKVQRLSAKLLGMLEFKDETEIIEAFNALKQRVISKSFEENLYHISPLNGANAVVIQDNKILLARRTDNGLWDTLGGLVDIDDTNNPSPYMPAREL